MKTVVTHFSPDLDAIASVWLIKRLLPGWNEAQMKFVAAGSTYEKMLPDADPNIIHVDTGFGKFDHHQSNEDTSATKLVFEYLSSKNYVPAKHIPALTRLVEVVNVIDHFGEFYFPEPAADRYQFMLYEIIEGMKASLPDDILLCERSFPLFDAVYQLLKNKVHAEGEIKKGFVFQSKLGKTIVMESKNEETMKLSLMLGYEVVIRRDPDRGFVRIKTQPKKKFDLTVLSEKLKVADSKATWFLHASKHMLLNGSSKNPDSVPSTLTLQKLIEIVKAI